MARRILRASAIDQTQRAPHHLIYTQVSRNVFYLICLVAVLVNLAWIVIRTNRVSNKYRNDKSQLLLPRTRRRGSQNMNTNPLTDCKFFYSKFEFVDHGCLVNEPSDRAHCQFHNLRIDLRKVHSDAIGGEPLWSMVDLQGGTSLRYERGGFLVKPLDTEITYTEQFHYLGDVFRSLIQTNDLPACDHTWSGTTLFIRRYEYVNLFHTMTDWWNLFFSLPGSNRTSSSPTNIVWLDAHAQGGLDVVWSKLVNGGNTTHLRRLGNNNSTLCFEKARFIPAGYSSPLYFRERPFDYRSCSNPDMMNSFVNHFLSVHGRKNLHRIPGRIVVLDRVPFKDHPKRDMSKLDRALTNLVPLAKSLPERLLKATGVEVTVQVETMSNLTMQDQLGIIRQADVLLGNHGAGLTHGIFLDDGAMMIEMSCAHGFFPELMQWKPRVTHHCGAPAFEYIRDEYWDAIVDLIGAHLKKKTRSNP